MSHPATSFDMAAKNVELKWSKTGLMLYNELDHTVFYQFIVNKVQIRTKLFKLSQWHHI